MINVVFSTHNGQETLPRMLESFTKLYVPLGGWKIIAVDNASNDNTPAILEKYSRELPLVILSQPEPGKNAALNLAIPYTDAKLIIFTDDDVIVCEDWLLAYAELATRFTEFSIFGGQILPEWPYKPPQWFLDEIPLGMAYALTDVTLLQGEVDPSKVWGPNMCVRKHVFDAGMKFDETVGPRPGSYIMGSETEFNRRAAIDGFRCFFYPSAIVKHIIREKQLRPEWVVARAFRLGRAKGKNLAVELNVVEKTLFNTAKKFPKWRIRKMLACFFESLGYRLLRNERKAFRSAYNAKYEFGVIFQFLLEMK